jgi:hypothetical protein
MNEAQTRLRDSLDDLVELGAKWEHARRDRALNNPVGLRDAILHLCRDIVSQADALLTPDPNPDSDKVVTIPNGMMWPAASKPSSMSNSELQDAITHTAALIKSTEPGAARINDLHNHIQQLLAEQRLRARGKK